jgi:predicted secreted hydrolase
VRAPGLALGLALALSLSAAWGAPPTFAPVLPGYSLQFPHDFGSHPAYRTEWWYVTGWLTSADHETLGFQITFFRTRPDWNEPNPSAFAPKELLIAHCALSDPAHGRLWNDQRVRRADPQLAFAAESDTRVRIDDWHLERAADGYRAQAQAAQFALDLQLAPTQAPMRNGDGGFSQKGPAPLAASYYYSEPHLRVSGRVWRQQHSVAVSGEAWLDHEWSSEYLDPSAVGWDWIGLNLDDGGAVMAFRMRDAEGRSRWSAASVRAPGGEVRTFSGGDVDFTALRTWHSPHTGADYPVSFRVRIGERQFTLVPLMDDQENDTRLSSGAVYWEGAVRASEQQRPVGRGYLELTGYERPLSLR